MALTLTSVTDPALAGFDMIIDVRSPSEFAEDHLPGAVNLPVLSDDERAVVGTIYKQESPFRARKVGAALVAQNAARHLQGPLSEMGGGWKPLIYCWRGGQRSGSFATILAQVGWRVELVAGGYKSWRAQVVQRVHEAPFPAPMVVIDGNTGSAKTELLLEMARQGAQVIDLEGLANHRGSLFGAMPGGQPSQKAFEGRLAAAVEALDPARPVFVEAESSKIGEVNLPPSIWAALRAAPRITLAVPRAARAEYLARAYGDVTADAARLRAVIGRLRPYQPAETIARWVGLAEQGAFEVLAGELMAEHYDPRYEKHRSRYEGEDSRRVVEAASLSPDEIPLIAGRLLSVAV